MEKESFTIALLVQKTFCSASSALWSSSGPLSCRCWTTWPTASTRFARTTWTSPRCCASSERYSTSSRRRWENHPSFCITNISTWALLCPIMSKSFLSVHRTLMWSALFFFWPCTWKHTLPALFLSGQRGEPGQREAVLWELDVPSEHALLSRGPRWISAPASDPACWTLLASRLRPAQKPRLQSVVGQQRLQVGFFSVWICFHSRLISNRSPNVNGTDGQSVPCALNLQLHDGWDHAVLPTAHTGGAGRASGSSAWSWPAQTAACENGQNWPALWGGRMSTQVGERSVLFLPQSYSVHVMHISTSLNQAERP